MRRALFGSLLLALVGCAEATPPPATPPAPTPVASALPEKTPEPPPAPPADPFALPTNLREEPAAAAKEDPAPAALPPAPQGIRGPDKACKAYVTRKGGKVPACADRAKALEALDAAISEPAQDKRDGLLVSLETCAGLPPGLVRALRADLAPTSCGDAIVEPLLARPVKGMSNAVLQTLTGQALAGRLSRMGADLPPFQKPFERKRVLEHIKGPIAKWLLAQSGAIEETAAAGAKLSSYGRALVAVEAGMADMRLVESARALPLPTEFDEELRNIYYGALDEALEPRKVRGRDAALVGLSDFGQLGVLRDPRLDRARVFLARLYRGRRIDALDGLALPALPALAPATVEQRLASKLGSFPTSQLLDPAQAGDPATLRALLEEGLPPAFRAASKAKATSPEVRRLLAQGRIEMGRRSWRGVDFDEATALTGAWPEGSKRPDEVTFLYALSLALRKGPESAAAMMLRAPSVSLGVSDVAALDKVAASPSPLAPLAAFDAAILLSVSPPESADATYWKGVARRFHEASGRLTDPALKSRADNEAKQAEEIAKALETK
jgi:hypothetical protein